MVWLDGKPGLLRYDDGAAFLAEAARGDIPYATGGTAVCSVQLSVPATWVGKELTVTLTAKDGSAVVPAASQRSNVFTFNVRPAKEGAGEYEVRVHGEKLLLYETTLGFSFVRRAAAKGKARTKAGRAKVCPTCHKPLSKCPYQGVH